MRPSRRIVIRSASANSSLIRCDTKIVVMPRDLSERTSSKSDSTSASVSELVGSSSSSTRAFIEIARAISTSCCWSGGRSETWSSTENSAPSCFWISAARRRLALQSMPNQRRTLRGPSRMFSATESSGTSVVSCVTVAIPNASARAGSRNLTGAPSSVIVPASGATWPERMFSSVDFPEPLAPTRLCTSARRTARSAPRSAWTPPKRLWIPLTLRNAPSLATAGQVRSDASRV